MRILKQFIGLCNGNSEKVVIQLLSELAISLGSQMSIQFRTIPSLLAPSYQVIGLVDSNKWLTGKHVDVSINIYELQIIYLWHLQGNSTKNQAGVIEYKFPSLFSKVTERNNILRIEGEDFVIPDNLLKYPLTPKKNFDQEHIKFSTVDLTTHE